MAWWLWMLLGFALIVCELTTPGGFFFLFFGLGAVAVGALVWLGAAGPAWLQWFLFSLISIGFLVPLRGRLLRRMAAGDDAAARVDALVGVTRVPCRPAQLGLAELARRQVVENERELPDERVDAGGGVQPGRDPAQKPPTERHERRDRQHGEEEPLQPGRLRNARPCERTDHDRADAEEEKEEAAGRQ